MNSAIPLLRVFVAVCMDLVSPSRFGVFLITVKRGSHTYLRSLLSLTVYSERLVEPNQESGRENGEIVLVP
jgi:hypothetical protein